MKTKNKKRKSSAEKLAEELLIEADQLRQITESIVREQLAGMFAPNVKKAMSQVIMEGKGYKNENEEGEEELSDDDLEDLERALEEGDDEDEWEEEELSEEDGGDSEEVSDDEWEEEDLDEADYSDEIDDEGEDMDDELEEGADVGSVDDEDYDFIEELREILEAEDEEEEDVDLDDLEDLDESEDGHSYSEKAPKVKMDEGEDDEEAEDLDEGEDGGSYTEKAPKVKMDEDMEKILDENKRLKSSLRKAIKSMKEATLDSKKMEVIDRIIEQRQVSDKGRIRITSAVDKAKNERDLIVLESTIKRQYPKRKKSVQESKKRSLANKSRSQKVAKKSKKAEGINENKTIGGSYADRLAQIAGI